MAKTIGQIIKELRRQKGITQEELAEKPVTLAIWEVADGKLSATLKEEYMN